MRAAFPPLIDSFRVEPALRFFRSPNVELLAKNLADKEKNGDLTSLLYGFSNRVSVQDLQNQLRDLGNAANHATTYGCTQKQFESWKYNRDLKLAIEQAIGEKIWGWDTLG